MRVDIKNPNYIPTKIKPLYHYFSSLKPMNSWEYEGMVVELDPSIDFKGNDALIRWTDIYEGFNDKIIVNSLEEFNSYFKQINA